MCHVRCYPPLLHDGDGLQAVPARQRDRDPGPGAGDGEGR